MFYVNFDLLFMSCRPYRVEGCLEVKEVEKQCGAYPLRFFVDLANYEIETQCGSGRFGIFA